MSIVGTSIGIVLLSGCVQTVTPRSNPFEVAAAKFRQTFSLTQPAGVDKGQAQPSANSGDRSEPVGAAPMQYQQHRAAAVAGPPLRATAQDQRQRPQTPIAQTAYQTEIHSRPMPPPPSYSQYPDEQHGPTALPIEQSVANRSGRMRVRPGNQEYWQSQRQSVAQAAYYGQPQDENYLYPPEGELQYAPLQYPAQELPSRSRYMRHSPAPVYVDNRPAMNPYHSQVESEWADQVAPGMPSGDAGLSQQQAMVPPSQGMPYQNQGQVDHYGYMNPLPPSRTMMGTGTGHLSEGFGLRGSMLRQMDMTANEIAIDLRMQNETLREQHKKISQNIKDMEKQLEDQQLTNKKTKQLLLESKRLNVSLRDDIARLRVHVEDLENEKEVIQKNADKALQEIESQLDTMLISTMSKNKPPQTGTPRN